MKKRVLDVIKPTFPKIVLYTFFVFMVPTFLKVCEGDACSWRLNLFAGYKLILGSEQGMLTFAMMLLLFAAAYLVTVTVTSLFNALKREQQIPIN